MLKDEDMQEIMARQHAIQKAEQEIGTHTLASNQHLSCAMWIFEVLHYTRMHSISLTDEEMDQRIEEYNYFHAQSTACKKDAVRARKRVEFLQESLTFFLAERYNFDPLGEPWILSLERKVLYQPS